MKNIIPGFSRSYYLTENGSVFDTSKNKYVVPDEKHYFWLRLDDEITRVRVSLKEIYRKVYGKEFCWDRIDDLDGEIWRPVARTDERYWVSNLGRVKSLTGYRARILKSNQRGGYEKVDIMYDKTRFTRSIHKLVAYAFLERPEDPDMVLHHINGCKTDNRADNLVWLTPEDHIRAHILLKSEGANNDQSEYQISS